jgi:transcriptional regulator with XRE-family HTH domain
MGKVNTDLMSCGEYIIFYRKKADITQRYLAERVGISHTYMCDIEKGRRPLNTRIAEGLIKHLGLTEQEICVVYDELLRKGGIMSNEREALIEETAACKIKIQRYRKVLYGDISYLARQ